jgi:hypothetical protein
MKTFLTVCFCWLVFSVLCHLLELVLFKWPYKRTPKPLWMQAIDILLNTIGAVWAGWLLFAR